MSVKKVVLVDDDADDRYLFIECYTHRTDILLMISLKSDKNGLLTCLALRSLKIFLI